MHLDGYTFIVRRRANYSSRDTMVPETGQDFVIQTDREYRIVMVRYSPVALRQQFISQRHRYVPCTLLVFFYFFIFFFLTYQRNSLWSSIFF